MNPKELHTLGIDIGSTTVKIAILDEENEVLFSDYERHYANIQETLSDLLGQGPLQTRTDLRFSGNYRIRRSDACQTSRRAIRPGSYRRVHGASGLCSPDRCCY